MPSRNIHLVFCAIFLCVFVEFVTSLEHVATEAAVPTSKNIEFPGNYEDVGGDFKKPAPFFHKFASFRHLGFVHGFIAAVSVILVSELGDKTFFIAAIMAMRHPRMTVFLGAISALTVMTILSAVLGFATTVIPRAYTHYISTALFAIFGLKMLKEGYDMSPNEGQEEYEELQKNIARMESDKLESEYGQETDVELGFADRTSLRMLIWKRRLRIFFSRVFLESFTMTFLAEWGDRSQLTTIILAAREDAFGVTLGAVIGHSMCTALAVIGGRIVAQRISVRSVTIIGGVVFLIFAVWALAMGPGT